MASDVSEFFKSTVKQIGKIPKGKVATYAQIAALSGKPHASRGVAWILNSSSEKYKLPWQRVINSKGQISFPKGSKSYRVQKGLLESEGVIVTDSGQIDLQIYQWRKKVLSKQRTEKSVPQMFTKKSRSKS